MKNRPYLSFLFFIPLASISLLMIASTGQNLWQRQLGYWLFGIGLFFVTQRIPFFGFVRFPTYLLLSLTGVLGLSSLFAQTIHASARWLRFGSYNFQSSEMLKPLFILLVIGWLKKYRPQTTKDYLLLIPLFIPILIIFFQPDFGMALSYLAIIVFAAILLRLPLKPVLPYALLAIIIFPLFFRFGLKDYQKNRLWGFLDPSKDPQGSGYHIIQSKIAIGTAGFWGRGYRQGSQNQLFFLPERHNDFIFASLTEETGFFGAFILLLVYFLFILFLLNHIFKTQRDETVKCFSLVFLLSLCLQITVNIGMNVGLLPVTGLTLPFISFGGSSLISLLLTVGLLFNES